MIAARFCQASTFIILVGLADEEPISKLRLALKQ